MKNLTWQNPEQLFVAQELINKVKSKCCGIKALLNTSEQMASDYFLENASFLKMDNLTLGYSFQNLFAAKLSGRISTSVQNVFTISKYSGLDPECGAIDSNIWPRPRTYTIGLNLNF